jgi:L-fucose isomerase-like protein
MLLIRPLAAALNPPAQVAAAVARVADHLERRQIAVRFVTGESDLPDALLIVTGGTEQMALAALARAPGPAFLLAHTELNSLPAALEVLGYLRQCGRRGRIYLLNDADDRSLARLARHLEVRRRLQSVRLGRIGVPSDWLVASVPSAEVVRTTWGPTVVDVPMDEVFEALRHADAGEATRVMSQATASAAAVCEPSPGDLDAAARVAVALAAVVRAHNLDACTVRCFDLVTEAATTGCLALSWLQDEGIVAGCEGDVPATLTLLWMQLVTGRPGFMANPQDADPAAGTLWLAHCTIARRLVSRYSLRSHFESSLGVGIAGELPPGPATVARVGGADLCALFASDAEIVRNGDSPGRCRTQVQVRLAAGVRELLARPLGNHHVLAPGHWANDLREYHELFVAGERHPAR